MAYSRFRGHEDKIVTQEPESEYDETEVQPRVHDQGRQAGDGSRRGGLVQPARGLDLAESVLRRWLRELTVAPTAAFPRTGRARSSTRP